MSGNRLTATPAAELSLLPRPVEAKVDIKDVPKTTATSARPEFVNVNGDIKYAVAIMWRDDYTKDELLSAYYILEHTYFCLANLAKQTVDHVAKLEKQLKAIMEDKQKSAERGELVLNEHIKLAAEMALLDLYHLPVMQKSAEERAALFASMQTKYSEAPYHLGFVVHYLNGMKYLKGWCGEQPDLNKAQSEFDIDTGNVAQRVLAQYEAAILKTEDGNSRDLGKLQKELNAFIQTTTPVDDDTTRAEKRDKNKYTYLSVGPGYDIFAYIQAQRLVGLCSLKMSRHAEIEEKAFVAAARAKDATRDYPVPNQVVPYFKHFEYYATLNQNSSDGVGLHRALLCAAATMLSKMGSENYADEEYLTCKEYIAVAKKLDHSRIGQLSFILEHCVDPMKMRCLRKAASAPFEFLKSAMGNKNFFEYAEKHQDFANKMMQEKLSIGNQYYKQYVELSHTREVKLCFFRGDVLSEPALVCAAAAALSDPSVKSKCVSYINGIAKSPKHKNCELAQQLKAILDDKQSESKDVSAAPLRHIEAQLQKCKSEPVRKTWAKIQNRLGGLRRLEVSDSLTMPLLASRRA